VEHSPAFDEWVLLKGEEYRRAILSVLSGLSGLCLGRAGHDR
jgi:hypothetical protein